MLFLGKWTIRPEDRNAAIGRFNETAASPPSGVRVIGRWRMIGQSGGLVTAEAKDALVMGKWCLGCMRCWERTCWRGPMSTDRARLPRATRPGAPGPTRNQISYDLIVEDGGHR